VGVAVPAGAAGLITGKQIKDHSIHKVDLAADALPKQGARGPMGPVGPQGNDGAQGAQGVPGVNGGFDPNKVQYVQGPALDIVPGDSQAVIADCPAGTKVVGGGYFASIGDPAGSLPASTGTSWGAVIYNGSSIDIQVNAYAVCVSP
jgi:hypothetical protein